jgi:hypothetical protein
VTPAAVHSCCDDATRLKYRRYSVITGVVDTKALFTATHAWCCDCTDSGTRILVQDHRSCNDSSLDSSLQLQLHAFSSIRLAQRAVVNTPLIATWCVLLRWSSYSQGPARRRQGLQMFTRKGTRIYAPVILSQNGDFLVTSGSTVCISPDFGWIL